MDTIKLVPGYLNSATKTVLIVMTLALVGFVSFGVEIPELFANAYLIVVGFYFGQKTIEDSKIIDKTV